MSNSQERLLGETSLDFKRRAVPVLAVLSLIGLVPPSTWSAATDTPNFKALATGLYVIRSPADLALTSLPASFVSPIALDNARKAASEQLDFGSAILLHRGSKMAVIPQAFAAGSSVVLVAPHGTVSSFILTEATVAELQTHLADGNLGAAHRILFDGSKPEGPAVVAPDSPTPGKNDLLAATVASMLQDIKNLSRLKTAGSREAFAPTSLYDSREVDAHVDAASAEIRRLIIDERFAAAATAAERIAPIHYWLEGERIPDYDSFYGKKDVGFIITAVVDLLRHRSHAP